MDSVLFPIAITIGLFLLGYYWDSRKSPEEIAEEKRLEESMQDEFLTDPETGMKITLEEAEEGLWPQQDEFATMPAHEIEKLPTEEAKQAARTLNFFLENKNYLRTELAKNEESFLDETAILGNHGDWSYSSAFESASSPLIVLMPVLEFKHLMYWVQLDATYGHYFFRSKTNTEKLFDRFISDDDINFENYECFTIQASKDPKRLMPILELFAALKNVELEFMEDHFFVRTTSPVNVKDVAVLESIVEQLINGYTSV